MWQVKGTGQQPPPPKPASGAASPPVQAPPAKVPLVQIPMAEYNQLSDDSDKKQFLGNYLYQFALYRIQNQYSSKYADGEQQNLLAGKVTGMILDGQTIEFILYLCSDRQAFYDIVKEAITLIESAPV